MIIIQASLKNLEYEIRLTVSLVRQLVASTVVYEPLTNINKKEEVLKLAVFFRVSFLNWKKETAKLEIYTIKQGLLMYGAKKNQASDLMQ